MMIKVISDIRLVIHDIQLLIKRRTYLIKSIISSLTFRLRMQHWHDTQTTNLTFTKLNSQILDIHK
jgi:hypothetical protein